MATSTSTFRLNVSAIKELCNGKTLLNGSGVPSTSLGTDGDFYIDTSTYYIFGPKDATTYWQNSASLVGPAGSAAGNTLFGEVSSFLFNDSNVAGYFTASALDVYNTDTIGIYVSSTGQSSALFETNNTTVAAFKSNGIPLLTINSAATVVSANEVQIDYKTEIIDTLTGTVRLLASTYIPVQSAGQEFLVSDAIHVSGGKVVLGDGEIITEAAVQDYKVIVFAEKTLVDSTIFNIVTGDGTISSFAVVAADGTSQAKIGTNLPSSEIYNLSSYPAHFTINGSVSSSSDISALTFSDNAGDRLLTTRQALSLAKLDPSTATTNTIATTLNTIIDGLTAHGLIT